MTAVSWTPPLQWGASSGAVWADLPFDDNGGQLTLQQSTGSEGGAVFDATFQFRFATVAGDTRILDGPILTGLVLQFFTTRVGGSVGPWSVEVGLVPDPQPAAFSTAKLPWARSEVSLGTFSLGAVPISPTTLLVPLDLFATATSTADQRLAVRKVVQSSRWNGHLALSFRSPVGTTAVRLCNGPTVPATAATTQERFWAGLTGGPAGPRQRYVRDGRFGVPALNTTLVEDGDTPGMWVRTHDQDPQDPPATYRPRPGEGSVDDGLPDV